MPWVAHALETWRVLSSAGRSYPALHDVIQLSLIIAPSPPVNEECLTGSFDTPRHNGMKVFLPLLKIFLPSTSLSLAGNLGRRCRGKARQSQSSATHSYQCDSVVFSCVKTMVWLPA